MSRLMRMAYGHGGTRLERTLVSAHHQEPPPTPLRLKLLLLAIWIIIPALVSLYAIPTTTLPMKTLIDISKLEVKPPPEPAELIVPETKPVAALEQPAEAPQQPLTDPKPAVEPPPRVRQAPDTHLEEVIRPAISRTSPAELPDPAEQRVPAMRDRRRIDAEPDTAPALRVRRSALPGEAPPERAAFSRSRGATSPDDAVARERVAVLRRQPLGGPSATGSVPQPQRMARSERSSFPAQEGAPRAVTTRERAGVGAETSGQTTPSAGLVRGVSLMSLEICSGSQQQEEAIKAILAVVGSRQSCRNERGEFQFKGTKRISSFNLMIFPSKGRRLSNRCEELEDAYQCLKHN